MPVIGGLSSIPFRNDELVLVVRSDDELRNQQHVRLSDIAHLPLIGLHADSSLHQLLTRAAGEHNLILNWRMSPASKPRAPWWPLAWV